MLPRLPLAAALLAAAFALPAAAADPAAVGVCRVCHGLDGRGTNPTIPNLGGQPELYLVKQLQDFRSGARVDEQMTIIAEGLDDAAIAAAAAWYAAVEASFTVAQ